MSAIIASALASRVLLLLLICIFVLPLIGLISSFKFEGLENLVVGVQRNDTDAKSAYKSRISGENDAQSPLHSGRRMKHMNRRFLSGNVCTNKDISISQGRDSSASGIPQYVVQIVNTCMSDCAPQDIHVFCGWFASAPLVNPNAFRRLAYNDCLVNNGRPLRHGEIIRFQYANSFMYPLRFKSAKFC